MGERSRQKKAEKTRVLGQPPFPVPMAKTSQACGLARFSPQSPPKFIPAGFPALRLSVT